jgi:metal-responsive CopG/Arc/MetJ family transcriptional regulator
MKKEFVGFRIESEILKDLEKQADREGRSKSNLIQLALKEYLESKKQNK